MSADSARPPNRRSKAGRTFSPGTATLIAAPTGSGKTLAAFLACIDRLVRKALAGDLRDRTEVLYISPLKALGNDIQKNLEVPLGEILQMAGERGLLMPQIRTAVRTGDTLMHERRAMLKKPPHILATAPESLYILLTAEKSRAILRDVETVIVDETPTRSPMTSVARIWRFVARKIGGAEQRAPRPQPTCHPERISPRPSGRAPSGAEGEGSAVRRKCRFLGPEGPRNDKGEKSPGSGTTQIAPSPVPSAFTRIGLSATQKPIEEIAHFLAGNGMAHPRNC